jgi:hypothetical protein
VVFARAEVRMVEDLVLFFIVCTICERVFDLDLVASWSRGNLCPHLKITKFEHTFVHTATHTDAVWCL